MFKEIKASKKSLIMRKPVYGVGINDSNYITRIKRMRCPYFEKWQGMLGRCYSPFEHLRFPTYIGCTVCDEWLTFSNFKKWMIKQDWQGNELDKDIKFTGNKVYSPDNCLFVSKRINGLLLDSRAARGEFPQGVSYHARGNKYQVHCKTDGKRNYLGLFSTPEEGSKVYSKFKSDHVYEVALEQDQPLRGYLIRIAGEINP